VTHPNADFQLQPQQTEHFILSVDPDLGADGRAIANSLFQTCEQDFFTLQTFFGGIVPNSMPFHVIITSGSQGASHPGCAATTLSIGANSGPIAFMRSLVIAEESEVFQANFGAGWNCGFSNGEGLSRVLANHMVPNAEPLGFVASRIRLDSPANITGGFREDWVNRMDQTDTNYFSIGCSVLFLN
jgi:hypothetical protein